MAKAKNSSKISDDEFMENWALADAAGRKNDNLNDLQKRAKQGDTEAIAQLMIIFGLFEDLLKS